MSISGTDTTFHTRRAFGVLPAVIIAYAGLAVVVSPEAYISLFELYLRQTVVLPLLLAVGLPIAGIVAQPRAPLRHAFDILRRRGLGYLLIVFFFCLGMTGFTTLKVSIPHFVPFYADPFFADLDVLVHGGNPGEIVHMLLPAWSHYPLAWLYGPAWFLLWFGLLSFVALRDDGRLRQRYFLSMALSVALLGTAAAMAFSSVGPVFYSRFYPDDRFAALMADVYASPTVGDYMREVSGFLFANYQSGGHQIGTGISAMPSMHLAIVTLNALMLSHINRWAGLFGWTYVALILTCSVFLGWHYAVDGYASIAAVSLIWWATGRVQRHHDDGTAPTG